MAGQRGAGPRYLGWHSRKNPLASRRFSPVSGRKYHRKPPEFMTLEAADGVMPEWAHCGDPLDGFIQGLLACHQLDVAAYDRAFLRQSIARRMETAGFDSIAGYADHLADRREEAEDFYRSLRVGHSGFFRNPLTFALLEQRILPDLLRNHQQNGGAELRIWSAGCAAGQEAWSIAILLDELIRTQAPALSYRIFASDFSREALATARAGVYCPASIGNVRLRQLDDCFTREGEGFRIVSRLRDQVDFSMYDLLDEHSSSPQASIYGDFDLILCCNLLFYYQPPIQQRILDKLCRALVPGGFLVSGETERKIVAARDGLSAIAATSAIFHKNSIMSTGNGCMPDRCCAAMTDSIV